MPLTGIGIGEQKSKSYRFGTTQQPDGQYPYFFMLSYFDINKIIALAFVNAGYLTPETPQVQRQL